ncbi:MAG TPA: SGNH/GDSL hydrolase family protein [Polyangiaceae bacterium]|nr:SGNH/GDSL hydrolase family protein [Polyangiaceae bacterium]
MPIARGARVLFQGDSITDAGRNHAAIEANDADGMGNGYAYLAICRLLADRPDEGLAFFNRGISGNKAVDLLERWEEDCLSLRPDLVSVLIGVNDLWHGIDGAGGRSAEEYEQDLRRLLDRTRQRLPQAAIVVGEPFVLRTGAVDGRWFPEFDMRRAAARRQAEAAGALFVPFQAVFDDAVRAGSAPAYWADDGVHPTPQGHQLMADAWIAAVEGS